VSEFKKLSEYQQNISGDVAQSAYGVIRIMICGSRLFADSRMKKMKTTS
jgi:hypothetical protein